MSGSVSITLPWESWTAPRMQQDVLQQKLNWIFSFEALTWSQWNSSSAIPVPSFWYGLSWICVPEGQGLLAGLLACGSLPWADSKGPGAGKDQPLLALISENQGLGAFLLEIEKHLAKPPQLLTCPESTLQTSVLTAQEGRGVTPVPWCPSAVPGSPCRWPGRAPQSWGLCLGLRNGFLQSRLAGFEAQSL